MKATTAALALCAATALPLAHAETAEPWTFRFGVHDVVPKSDNGTLADGALKSDLDDSVRPTASIEYYATPNLGFDLLGRRVVLSWREETFEHFVSKRPAEHHVERLGLPRQLPGDEPVPDAGAASVTDLFAQPGGVAVSAPDEAEAAGGRHRCREATAGDQGHRREQDRMLDPEVLRESCGQRHVDT